MAFLDLTRKFKEEIQYNGPFAAVGRLIRWLSNRARDVIGWGDQIEKRRLWLSRMIDREFSGTVYYGPFKGLKLSDDIWWGKTDRAGMLFGIYEQEVLDALTALSARTKTCFIELGAADGYYGVGVLVSGLFDKSYCFELSEKGQKTILRNAEINHVSDRIEVFGAADSQFYNQLPSEVLSDSVVVVDIEGAEFDIVTYDMMKAFSNSVIIIELHDHFFSDGDVKIEKLRESAEKHFDISEFFTGSRDMSIFPELKSFCDTDRWLICSEGRRSMPHWYILTPREEV